MSCLAVETKSMGNPNAEEHADKDDEKDISGTHAQVQKARKYVMVTHWDGYWTNRHTSFANGMITCKNPLTDDVDTIFIKINKTTKKIERGWFGRVQGILRKDDKTEFKVVLDGEASRDDLCAYEHLKSGWHECEGDGAAPPTSHSTADARLSPPFFEDLENTTDWREFEEFCYLLLRLLGIHRAYKFPREEQAGKSDGFFMVNNLAVIYDPTLKKDFGDKKQQQIENYCLQLRQGTVSITPDISELVEKHHQKQVWVITRGKTGLLRKIGDVEVKEVAIADLQRIYFDRLRVSNDPMTEERLQTRLQELGE